MTYIEALLRALNLSKKLGEASAIIKNELDRLENSLIAKTD